MQSLDCAAVPSRDPSPDAMARLLRLLTLEPLDRDLFLGATPPGEGRLFGGLVAAQAVMAASLTLPEDAGGLHSLHAYFLRPGRHKTPIRFVVDRIRDGRSFTTRRVVAHQGGEAIFNLSASYARPEKGIAHHDPMPDAPGPDGLEAWEAMRERLVDDATARRRRADAIEVRVCDPDDPDGRPQPARKRIWLRPRGPLPDDPRVHEAVLVYATDRTLASTASRPHGIPWDRRMIASLDHAVWIHRPPRLDDWVLYVSDSPAAHAARGLVLGALYDREGERFATVAQEALVRERKD